MVTLCVPFALLSKRASTTHQQNESGSQPIGKKTKLTRKLLGKALAFAGSSLGFWWSCQSRWPWVCLHNSNQREDTQIETTTSFGLTIRHSFHVQAAFLHLLHYQRVVASLQRLQHVADLRKPLQLPARMKHNQLRIYQWSILVLILVLVLVFALLFLICPVL